MRFGLTGLCKIELPDATVRLCDGGFFVFDGETYRASHSTYGTIANVSGFDSGVGSTLPALKMTLLPPEGSAPALISKPGNQTSRVQFWIGEFDPDTHVITRADREFDGFIDQTNYVFGTRTRRLEMSVVSLAERLFEGNIGNSLNPTFHKSVWPGETGHDHAIGLPIPVAWGAEQPPRSGSAR